MLQELTEAHYGKNDYIFREGDPTEYFHIVKEGTVKCVKFMPDGKECTLKMLSRGISSVATPRRSMAPRIRARPSRWEMSASSR
jgi:hypothetical protein